MTIFPLPQCLACIHYIPATDAESEQGRETCAAFPDGIPRRIWQGEADHRGPYRGDHGIRFTQNPADWDYDFDLFRVGQSTE